MRDPHVKSLQYRLKTSEAISFRSPPPLEEHTGAFRARLEDEVLTLEMKEYHPTEESARSRVEPYLKAWELDTNLRDGPGTIRFEFEKSNIIDRNPPRSGETILTANPGTITLCGGSVRFHVVRKAYPSPPSRFVVTPDVEMMWARYLGYRNGKEPLLSMAYFCLSLLEGTTGSSKSPRKAVCQKYNIDQTVRKKLGDLVSEKGDPGEARKFNSGATRTPLTQKEKDWVDEVIKAIIRRKAEYDADPTTPLPKIAVGDFVTL
jgi:hypothetical protein